MFDLIIHNGRVVDYKNHLDQVTDIAVKDGRIASIGTALGKAKSHLDAKNLLVIPGIVDSHMHASSWLGGPRQPENAGFSRCYNCHRNGRPCGQR